MAAKGKLRSFITQQYNARDQSTAEPTPLLDRILTSLSEGSPQKEDATDPEAPNQLPQKVTNLVLELLFGALETVASACCAAVLCLNKHPHVVDKLKSEISDVIKKDQGNDPSYDDLMSVSYLTDVMTEVLRLMPPTVGAFRKTLKPIEVNVSLAAEQPISLLQYYFCNMHV